MKDTFDCSVAFRQHTFHSQTEEGEADGETPSGPILLTWFNFSPAWIRNYMHYKVWDKRPYPLNWMRR